MSATRITGRVKWFNSKAGYGFITASEGELAGKDIFVHYSSIKSDASHYKYLTQGEYVDFTLTKPSNEKHEFHAVEVSGVKGGPILCETRRLNVAVSRSSVDENAKNGVATSETAEPRVPQAQTTGEQKPRRVRQPRGPPGDKQQVDTEGFTTVKKRNAPRAKKATA